MIRFFIYTLGCKVNNCDSNEIANVLLSHGCCLSEPECSDLIIINSCAVTSESVRKTRQNINKFKKINKDSFLILTGCASALEQFSKNENVDLISKKENLISDIKNRFNLDINPRMKKNSVFLNLNDKTRAFLKIEDGCENFCSYCIIPFARGKIKSKSLEEIDVESKGLSEFGFKEINLTGINLGRYGFDIGLGIIDAIKAVKKYFKRIRLSSLEPDVVSDGLLNFLLGTKEFCPHFHLSLQSGSDKILSLMNRKYNLDLYIELINKIRSKFENCTFATDLIVGFPGETDEDFSESLEIVRKVRFIKVNVFPYSPRPFTLASNFKQIDSEIKKLRVNKAIEYSDKISKCEISKFFGKKLNVLFEKEVEKSVYSGYSENYIKILKKSDENLCGKIEEIIFLPNITYS